MKFSIVQVALIAVLTAGISAKITAWSISRRDHNSLSQSAASTSVDKNVETSKLGARIKADLADYRRLQSLEERYAKADEIFGKILMILLSDVGLRIRPQTVAAIKGLADRANVAAPLAASVGAAAPMIARPESKSPLVRGGPDLRGQTASLEDMRTPAEAEEFLRRSQIDDFEEVLRGSADFSNKNGLLEHINGRFNGTTDVAGGRWDIEFTVQGAIEAGSHLGKYSVIMSQNGKVFSRKSGEGSLDTEFREIASDPRVLLVESAPNQYLQIYYVQRNDSLIMNILDKPKGQTYRTIGSAILKRY